MSILLFGWAAFIPVEMTAIKGNINAMFVSLISSEFSCPAGAVQTPTPGGLKKESRISVFPEWF